MAKLKISCDLFLFSASGSKVKSVPNFKELHHRIFEKDIPINEIQNHIQERAKMVKSGKKAEDNKGKFNLIFLLLSLLYLTHSILNFQKTR